MFPSRKQNQTTGHNQSWSAECRETEPISLHYVRKRKLQVWSKLGVWPTASLLLLWNFSRTNLEFLGKTSGLLVNSKLKRSKNIGSCVWEKIMENCCGGIHSVLFIIHRDVNKCTVKHIIKATVINIIKATVIQIIKATVGWYFLILTHYAKTLVNKTMRKWRFPYAIKIQLRRK